MMPAVTTTPCTDGVTNNGTASGSHKELVQKWVNSIQSTEGADVGEAMVAGHNTADLPVDGKVIVDSMEDDLSLGAEARMLRSELNAADSDAMVTGGHTDCGPPVDYGAILRQRFALKTESSFNSDSSRHSLEQLLNEHRLDPEKILRNLGFVSRATDESRQIPEHFLLCPSKANGISVDDYLSRNPKLRRKLERKLALQNAFQAVTAAASGTGRDRAGSACTMQAFSQVAQTVTLINRFRSRTLNRQSSVLAEPVLRTSGVGSQYWSILEEDNSRFLERIGYYDGTTPASTKPGKSNTKKSWGAVKSAAIKLALPDGGVTGSNRKLRTPSPTRNLSSSNLFVNATNGPSPKHLSPVAPLAGSVVPPNEESGTESKEARPISPLNIPSRFFSFPSACVTAPAGISLARPLFAMSACEESSPGEVIVSDEERMAPDHIIPTIEINNNNQSRHSSGVRSDQSGFEWYHSSSMSSSTTDDVLSPSSDDSYVDKLRVLRALRATSSGEEEAERLGLLAVPSDAASTVSSHTLVEQEGTIADVNTSQSLIEVSLDKPDDDERNFSESHLAVDDRPKFGHEANSFDIEEVDSNADMLNDNLAPFSLPTRIRCVLRRQGSSQSDSSGFADTDQLETQPDPTAAAAVASKRSLKRMQLTSRSFNIMDSSDHQLVADSVLPPTVDLSLRPDSSEHSVPPSDIDYSPSRRQSDEATQTEFPEVIPYTVHTNRENSPAPEFPELVGLGDAEKSSRVFTTRMYIDSPAPTVHVPLLEKTEVVLIVGKSHGNQETRSSSPLSSVSSSAIRLPSSLPPTVTDSSLPRRYLTSVDIKSSASSTGRLTLTPTLSRSVEVITGQRRETSPMSSRSASPAGGPLRRKFEELSAKQQRNETSAESLKRDGPLPLPFDVTDHQILHSMINRSMFVSPQTLAYLCPPTEWNSIQSAQSATNSNQCLMEEVKLVQQALAKYRLEMKALTLRTRVMYEDIQPRLPASDRQELSELSSLQTDVLREVETLDSLLSHRMKSVISVSRAPGFSVASSSVAGSSITADDPTPSLGTLGVVHEMSELLREQLYHSNIVSGLSTSCSPWSGDPRSTPPQWPSDSRTTPPQWFTDTSSRYMPSQWPTEASYPPPQWPADVRSTSPHFNPEARTTPPQWLTDTCRSTPPHWPSESRSSPPSWPAGAASTLPRLPTEARPAFPLRMTDARSTPPQCPSELASPSPGVVSDEYGPSWSDNRQRSSSLPHRDRRKMACRTQSDGAFVDDGTDRATTSAVSPLAQSADLLMERRSLGGSGGGAEQLNSSGSQDALSAMLTMKLIDRITSLERRIVDQQLTTSNAIAGVLQQQGSDNNDTKKKKRSKWSSLKPPWKK